MNKNINIQLGKNIKTRRQELGLTQLQLAQKIGIESKTTITDVEKGRTSLYVSNLFRYAKALKCKPGYLLNNIKD